MIGFSLRTTTSLPQFLSEFLTSLGLSQVGEGIDKRHDLYILGEVVKFYVVVIPSGCGGSILASSLSSGVCVCVQSSYMASPLNPGMKGSYPGFNSVVCPPPALYLPTE